MGNAWIGREQGATRDGGGDRNRRRLMQKFMLAATIALAFGCISASPASAAPANAPAIAQAAGAASPAAQAGCWFRRWCGPTKCHRRLVCR
jgi:hypothetical protein